MDLELAAMLANSITFVLCILAAIWYVVPWLRRQPLATALTVLLWVHAFRYVALQIYSAQKTGFAVPDGLRDHIAYGDVAGALLAILAIVLIRFASGIAVGVTWLFVVATVIDLGNAMAGGMREGMMAEVSGITWMILSYYVPVLWTSTVMIIWQLVTRRGEELTSG
jgi:hypothetical protein